VEVFFPDFRISVVPRGTGEGGILPQHRHPNGEQVTGKRDKGADTFPIGLVGFIIIPNTMFIGQVKH